MLQVPGAAQSVLQLSNTQYTTHENTIYIIFEILKIVMTTVTITKKNALTLVNHNSIYGDVYNR